MRIVTLTSLFMIALLGCDSPKERKVKEQEENTVNGKHDFYFVRHGQTPWGAEDILKGPQDLELNQTGIQQATQAGKTLQAIVDLDGSPNGVIITSTLKRAIETAEKISGITNISIASQEEGLQERYYGDYRLVTNGDTTQIPPDAETTEIFEERVTSALQKVLHKYKGLTTPLIIVSHQKVFEYVSKKLTGTSYKLSQGGVAHFTTCDNGETWKIEILETCGK